MPETNPNGPKIFAILHHSPIDVVVLLPLGLVVTSNTNIKADVLLTTALPREIHASFVFLFIGQPQPGIPILDESKPGEYKILSSATLDQLFEPKVKKTSKKPEEKKIPKPVASKKAPPKMLPKSKLKFKTKAVTKVTKAKKLKKAKHV